MGGRVDANFDVAFSKTPTEDASNADTDRSVRKEVDKRGVSGDTEEFVIDKVVDHKVNRNRRHKLANVGELLFKVGWYGYEPDKDTWEPVRHLPQGKILSYVKRDKIDVPRKIDHAIDGQTFRRQAQAGVPDR